MVASTRCQTALLCAIAVATFLPTPPAAAQEPPSEPAPTEQPTAEPEPTGHDGTGTALPDGPPRPGLLVDVGPSELLTIQAEGVELNQLLERLAAALEIPLVVNPRVIAGAEPCYLYLERVPLRGVLDLLSGWSGHRLAVSEEGLYLAEEEPTNSLAASREAYRNTLARLLGSPRSGEIQLEMIQLEIEAGRTTEAIVLGRTLLAAQDADAEVAQRARLLLAPLYLKEGDPETATDLLIAVARHARHNAEKAEAFLAIARRLVDRGDIASARRYLLFVVEHEQDGPRFQEAAWWLAHLANREDDYQTALNYANHAVAAGRSRFRQQALLLIADIQLIQGNTRAAEETLWEALETQPEGVILAETGLKLGQVLAGRARYLDAMSAFRLVVGQPVAPELKQQAHLELGRLQVTLGLQRRARVSLQKARVGPDGLTRGEALLQQAALEEELGRLRDALELIGQAVAVPALAERANELKIQLLARLQRENPHQRLIPPLAQLDGEAALRAALDVEAAARARAGDLEGALEAYRGLARTSQAPNAPESSPKEGAGSDSQENR